MGTDDTIENIFMANFTGNIDAIDRVDDYIIIIIHYMVIAYLKGHLSETLSRKQR